MTEAESIESQEDLSGGIRNKPSTPLPWKYLPGQPTMAGGQDEWDEEDEKYVLHASKAYPVLVRMLSMMVTDAEFAERTVPRTFEGLSSIDARIAKGKAMVQYLRFARRLLENLGELDERND